jgi:hypothetical protein
VEKLKTPSVIPHTQGNLALFAGAATVTPLWCCLQRHVCCHIGSSLLRDMRIELVWWSANLLTRFGIAWAPTYDPIHHFIPRMFQSQMWLLVWQLIQDIVIDNSDIYKIPHNAVPPFCTFTINFISSFQHICLINPCFYYNL